MFDVTYAGKSDAGLRRPNNEDSLIVEPALGLAVVADGMGGAASGEVASRIFADTAREVFSKVDIRSDDALSVSVTKVFLEANNQILATAKKRSEHRGMGCTAELLAYHSGNYVVGHVGDSRTYLLRQRRLKQLTRDHSLIQEQIDQGVITPAEAESHPLKNVIVRAVGVNESLAVDVIKGTVQTGDVFLLCSDGLTDMLEDDEIQQLLLVPSSVNEKAQRLIEAANAAGGHDNITVALCEVR